ncbi:MAG: transporter substrate-binding domain-containing protein [Pseudomonadota bacterium]|nr:transporter substrate-binding domain-containing protein [Pseudomonadota bacterium]
MRKSFGPAVALILLLTLLAPQGAALAQQTPEPLKVGIFVNPPFVMKEHGRLTGMAVELWQELAARLGRSFSYVEFETVHDLIEATAGGSIDVAVTNLTINQARAERLDFTQPWFDGGYRIMIATHRGSGLSSLIQGLSDAGFLRAYAWIGFILVAATILLTFFDRRFDRSFPRRWRDGIAESFYSVMSVATTGRTPERKNLFGWVGRIWQGLWLVCGIAVLAYVTSSITSVMTTLSLTGQIEGLADIGERPVGVLTGTVQEEFAHTEGLYVRSYRGIDAAIEALVEGDVAAIIHDAPVLEYYAHTHAELPVDVVGRLFEKDKYGFALPHGSALTHPLTVELLGIVDADEIEELRAKYFGPAD